MRVYGEVMTFPGWCDDPVAREVPKSECVLVTVPTRFYRDHVERDLTAGLPVTEGKLLTTVWLDRTCFHDLFGDADYYASFAGEDYNYNRPYCDSARTTLRRLRAQAPYWAKQEDERLAELARRRLLS
jgi:hypothetical protein